MITKILCATVFGLFFIANSCIANPDDTERKRTAPPTAAATMPAATGTSTADVIANRDAVQSAIAANPATLSPVASPSATPTAAAPQAPQNTSSPTVSSPDAMAYYTPVPIRRPPPPPTPPPSDPPYQLPLTVSADGIGSYTVDDNAATNLIAKWIPPTGGNEKGKYQLFVDYGGKPHPVGRGFKIDGIRLLDYNIQIKLDDLNPFDPAHIVITFFLGKTRQAVTKKITLDWTSVGESVTEEIPPNRDRE